MNSFAMETTYSVLLPKLATGHYFEPLILIYVLKIGFAKIQLKNDTCISGLPCKCFTMSFPFKIVIHFYFVV